MLVTAVHDTAAAGTLLDRVAQDGWRPERVKVDGIYTGERMAAAAERHGVDVQVSTREEVELENWGWGGLPVVDFRKRVRPNCPMRSP